MTGFEKLKRLYKSNAGIGKALGGLSAEAVRKWERNGVPADRVLQIVEVTGRQVTPHELRPDLYPDPDWMPPSGKEAA